jgi:ATP-dependent Clp protease ATP-binding subunit ClpA
MGMPISTGASQALTEAEAICRENRHEFQTPEHLLSAITRQMPFVLAAFQFEGCEAIEKPLAEYLDSLDRVPDDRPYEFTCSTQMNEVMYIAYSMSESSASPERPVMITVPMMVKAILSLDESHAAYFISLCAGGDTTGFMRALIEEYATQDDYEPEDMAEADADAPFDEGKPKEQAWKHLVTCLNDTYTKHNPLIGREKEMQRTIEVLCRKEKNNPLHVGEPGVGKTALIYGLAARIERGDVPRRLAGCRIYQLDLGSLVAGTSYRGDFEKRIKMILDGAQQEGNAILYIDEIHNLVGSGVVSGSIDGAHMMMPYMERGDVRFIGSTTYDQLNRQLSKNQGVARRFHQIDIGEPSIDETKEIVRQLRQQYESFHGVTYTDEALDFAVEASAKHVNDRFLPDKALDLIDEAGAAKESAGPAMNDVEPRASTVTKADIADVLAKTCKVDAMAMKDDDNERLATLSQNLLAKIYGQDEAIRQVVEAVQMSKAGLLDDGKPTASLLFVGPTGVGKTEVARQLALELGIELVRFDMSEYTEKHTVAKLIGSPAGYVGYEDGGLLTDAIRRSPNCVLLLDEIEKAHQDIYNILLQVMDYARLTDNKGHKADFRNVILIMTSNAGAQYAGQASIGFRGSVTRGEAMLKQVKKTFKPEFINRLSGTVVFNEMDRQMATLILRKKLRELQQKLEAKQVTMTLTDNAFNQLLEEGFTSEYGAREMDRVISLRLKSLLTREILFGSLHEGGSITIDNLNK